MRLRVGVRADGRDRCVSANLGRSDPRRRACLGAQTAPVRLAIRPGHGCWSRRCTWHRPRDAHHQRGRDRSGVRDAVAVTDRAQCLHPRRRPNRVGRDGALPVAIGPPAVDGRNAAAPRHGAMAVGKGASAATRPTSVASTRLTSCVLRRELSRLGRRASMGQPQQPRKRRTRIAVVAQALQAAHMTILA